MTTTAYFAAGARLWPDYKPHLERAIAETGLDLDLITTAPDPEKVDFIIFAPGGDITDFSLYPNARAVLNLWAGVERIVTNPTLTQPLCRMVDPALTQGMVEWVTGHVLRYHLGIDQFILNQDGIWREGVAAPPARLRPVAMLGLGELGRACGQALAGLGFPVLGWGRSPREVPGIDCHSGEEGLETVLRQAQIVVTLLPLTRDTENLLDARRLGWLPDGAMIVNPGRGPLVDDDALLAALDTGKVGHATLDVFRQEPLPAAHPYWAHPRVTVTPHIAAATPPDTASVVVIENIARSLAGKPLLHLVDRERGY
ncbi:2-hydroxyacid dehydrogenase [Halodurantibacterium flavum]|uniref:2-hydroxyacid dehydrogenase n=1 Tax=Halodurantibacterium flavum TaxID=1382802 RepID=A0ABW4S633_9RHOB